MMCHRRWPLLLTRQRPFSVRHSECLTRCRRHRRCFGRAKIDALAFNHGCCNTIHACPATDIAHVVRENEPANRFQTVPMHADSDACDILDSVIITRLARFIGRGARRVNDIITDTTQDRIRFV